MAASPLAVTGEVVLNELMYHPPSHRAEEEWLELHNTGAVPINLANWRLTDGVQFVFPPVVIPAGGFLVVAADGVAFSARNPGVSHFVAGWEGRLSDSGETVTLTDAWGAVQDSVRYATEGDWAVRVRGAEDDGHRGWTWLALHDGLGRSAERLRPTFAVDSGQIWAPSRDVGGTPGAPNSVNATNIAPVLLDVQHRPAVPRSTDPVAVTVRVLDDQPGPVTVRVHHRVDGELNFQFTSMVDDGAHGDGRAGDGEYGAMLPARPQDTIVEFYVEALDALGRARTWPAEVPEDGGQFANGLYQVDDRPYTAPQPLYRVIMTAREQAELAAIDALPWYQSSNAEMNATFVSTEAGESEVRYTVGFRLRGSTTRALEVKSRRINFNTDHRWQGLRAINLNAANPHAQISGSLLSRRAGLPAARARAVQLRENNRQRVPAVAPNFGVYAELEVLNGDFGDRQFPGDGAGNIYEAAGNGNLDYLDDPELYRTWEYYSKLTNTAEYDWTDLIELTAVLNLTPPTNWFEALGRVADIPEWVTYFAVNTVLANSETALGTGGPGDYAMYRGVADPRFRLIIHDLDSVLGVAGGLDQPLWRATNNPAIHRFLTAPEVAPLYYAELRRLVDRDLTPETVGELLEQFLGGFAPPETIQAMASAYRTRVDFIRARLPEGLVIGNALPVVGEMPVSDSPVIALSGLAGLAETRAVRVSGLPASWNPVTGEWAIPDLPLWPGVNALRVQSLDGAGHVLAEEIRRVWLRGLTMPQGGRLTTDATWSAAQGAFVVTNELVVPPGLTLTIEPGTTVFFRPNARLLVRGRLVAEGTPERRIHFGREPGTTHYWGGIRLEDSRNNRLREAELVYHSEPALFLTNATLLAEGVSFYGSFGNILWGEDSSVVFRRCEFPDMPYGEHVRLLHLPPDGEWLFEGNVFGTTVGYSDIMDITGCKRPGPILRVLNNVFKGGSDDGLDLDGTDAHIEGNLFMGFHKNNDSTSESSAIATGTYEGRTSDLVIVRNVFLDNDHDILLKDGADVRAVNNTFVGTVKGTFLINEPDRPGEAPPHSLCVEDSIVWNTPAILRNLNPALVENGTLHLEVRRSLLPQTWPWSGTGNFVADPRFANPSNDLQLQPSSPAVGLAEGGLDLGAHVPAGAVISGGPPSVTWRREATWRVTGPGLTHFRWKLDAGPWSDPLPLGDAVVLTDLSDGEHEFFALGLDSSGAWQPESQPSVSPRWRVAPTSAGLRLNEVLAWNRNAWVTDGLAPDFVELYNDSPNPVDVSGLSLTDDPLDPRRFVFPAGTILAPDAYLVVRLVPGASPGGLTAGFGLDREGDAVLLFDRPGGRGLLTSVGFGPQVADCSVGDRGDGVWTLTQPTPGAPNRLERQGDARRVRLSEWLARPGPAWDSDFLELHNPEPLPVALHGLWLSTEPVGAPREFPFPPLTFLAANGYGVFLADGTVPPQANRLPFRLSGEQGTLALIAPDGAWLDWIAYDTQAPGVSQGRSPDGNGLVVALPVPTPGTGLAALPGAGQVILNEILANNENLTNEFGTASDWIELHNQETNWVSLAGLSLSDRLDDPQKWLFPGDTLLPPLGYLIVRCESALPPSATNTGFGLSADGESVHLFDSAGRLLDTVTFGPQAADLSLARWAGASLGWVLAQPTPGGPNEPADLGDPSLLRVNEWMADPSAGPDWLELFNPGPQPVVLTGLRLSDSRSNPSKYEFPPFSFLAGTGGGFVTLIADEEPADGPSHLPFRLSAQGEAIVLSNSDGTVLDEIQFGRQRPDLSQGRYPDGAGTVRDLTAGGSPGGPNVLNARPVVAAIEDQTISPDAPWEWRCVAFDPDPGQTVSFGLRPPVPVGLTIEPSTGWLRWSPGADQAGLTYGVTVVATDNGDPPQTGTRSFALQLAPVEPAPAWDPPWRDGTGDLHFSWAARPGTRYVVESTDDLLDPSWTIYQELAASGSRVQLVVPTSLDGQRFFRLRRLR